MLTKIQHVHLLATRHHRICTSACCCSCSRGRARRRCQLGVPRASRRTFPGSKRATISIKPALSCKTMLGPLPFLNSRLQELLGRENVGFCRRFGTEEDELPCHIVTNVVQNRTRKRPRRFRIRGQTRNQLPLTVSQLPNLRAKTRNCEDLLRDRLLVLEQLMSVSTRIFLGASLIDRTKIESSSQCSSFGLRNISFYNARGLKPAVVRSQQPKILFVLLLPWPMDKKRRRRLNHSFTTETAQTTTLNLCLFLIMESKRRGNSLQTRNSTPDGNIE